MDRLNDRILALCPNAIPDSDFLLYQPPSGGIQIHNWNEEKLGLQPSDEDLAKVELTPLPAPPTQLSFRGFIRLFTATEQLAIVQAAMTDPATKLWYDQAVGAQFIDLSDPDLADGLQAMVDAELLSATRRDDVLAGLGPA